MKKLLTMLMMVGAMAAGISGLATLPARALVDLAQRDVHGPRRMPGLPFMALADVDQRRAVRNQLEGARGVHGVADPAVVGRPAEQAPDALEEGRCRGGRG